MIPRFLHGNGAKENTAGLTTGGEHLFQALLAQFHLHSQCGVFQRVGQAYPVGAPALGVEFPVILLPVLLIGVNVILGTEGDDPALRLIRPLNRLITAKSSNVH